MISSSIIQSINHSINHSINQSNIQSFNQSINQSSNHSINLSPHLRARQCVQVFRFGDSFIECQWERERTRRTVAVGQQHARSLAHVICIHCTRATMLRQRHRHAHPSEQRRQHRVGPARKMKVLYKSLLNIVVICYIIHWQYFGNVISSMLNRECTISICELRLQSIEPMTHFWYKKKVMF